VLGTLVPPALKGVPYSFGNVQDLTGTETDVQTIQTTANIIDQKAGATNDAPPNKLVPETVVTAIDGQVVDSEPVAAKTNLAISAFAAKTKAGKTKRSSLDYEQVLGRTGSRTTDRDGSIEGTAYLTYTVPSNATYNVDACLDFCSRVDGCGTRVRSSVTDIYSETCSDQSLPTCIMNSTTNSSTSSSANSPT
jgi:hypothetical protein